MKRETGVGIACAIALATALGLGTLEITTPPKHAQSKAEQVVAVPATVGVRTDEMLSICRAEYGPQSTVYERKPGRLACDTRGATVAKQ